MAAYLGEAAGVTMQIEHEAWLDVVKEWRRDVGEMNDEKYNKVVAAIRVWGEELVALRVTQSGGDVVKAREDQRERYEALQE